MTLEKTLQIAGHRGMGCTDHENYSHRDLENLPVENTAQSFTAAYKQGKAAYIELDVVESVDKVLFTIHNVVPKDHFFEDSIPSKPLNQTLFEEINRTKTGRLHTGEVCRFSEALEISAENDPKTVPWAVNVELKGVQGSGQPYEANDYLNRVAETIKESSLPPERVLFSSFSLENIIRMSDMLPEARYGMLFNENDDVADIYADHKDEPPYQYLPFNVSQINYVCEHWEKHANPQAKLGFFHPETLTIGEAELDVAAKKGMGINCWAIFEKYDKNRAEIYKNTIAKATTRKIPFTAITDYLPEMQELAKDPSVRAIRPV